MIRAKFDEDEHAHQQVDHLDCVARKIMLNHINVYCLFEMKMIMSAPDSERNLVDQYLQESDQ